MLTLQQKLAIVEQKVLGYEGRLYDLKLERKIGKLVENEAGVKEVDEEILKIAQAVVLLEELMEELQLEIGRLKTDEK